MRCAVVYSSVMLALATLLACSSNAAEGLELVESKAFLGEIKGAGVQVSNPGTGEQVGALIPTQIAYTLKVRVIGNGDTLVSGLELSIEPGDELRTILDEAGLSPFDEVRAQGSIGSETERHFHVRYGGLGVRDTTGLDHGTESPPPAEVLDQIRSRLHDATTVLRASGSEVARFALSNVVTVVDEPIIWPPEQ